MLAAGIISLVVFFLLALSILFLPSFKIGTLRIGTYWLIAMLGAATFLLSGLVSPQAVWDGLTADSEINPIKILALFFSMTFLSVVLDEVGLFRYLAKKAVAVAKTSQFGLFVILYFLTAVLTVFTSNDIVILTLTPFICFFCKNTKIHPLPYLVSEFAAANTWSMMLVIGNPTNIYLATSAGIGFIDYFKVMALPTVVSGITEMAIILLLFYRKLKKPLQPQEDDFRIESKPDLVSGVIHLAVCLVFLVISGYIGLPMWLISVVCAGSLLLSVIVVRLVTKKNWKYLADAAKRLPWQLIPFVLSMFIIVICLNTCGISEKLGEILGDKACVWTYGGASLLASNFINNIPMSILFSTLPVDLTGAGYLQAIYATVIGSNIGAFLTPIGALAGIMFTGLTTKYEVKYSFLNFVTYGAIIGIPTAAAALGILCLMV